MNSLLDWRLIKKQVLEDMSPGTSKTEMQRKKKKKME